MKILRQHVVTFIFILLSISPGFGYTPSKNPLSQRYEILYRQIKIGDGNAATKLLPQIYQLKKDFDSDKKATAASLKAAVRTYESTFNILERHNPFSDEPEECWEKDVKPLETKNQKYLKLAHKIETLLSLAKYKAGLLSNEYWETGSGTGSKSYWTKGEGPGSKHYWAKGEGKSSKSYWEKGEGKGSKSYWLKGDGKGSRSYWEKGEEKGSRSQWIKGKDPAIFDPSFDVNDDDEVFGFAPICLGLISDKVKKLPSVCHEIKASL